MTAALSWAAAGARGGSSGLSPACLGLGDGRGAGPEATAQCSLAGFRRGRGRGPGRRRRRRDHRGRLPADRVRVGPAPAAGPGGLAESETRPRHPLGGGPTRIRLSAARESESRRSTVTPAVTQTIMIRIMSEPESRSSLPAATVTVTGGPRLVSIWNQALILTPGPQAGLGLRGCHGTHHDSQACISKVGSAIILHIFLRITYFAYFAYFITYFAYIC